LGQVRIALSDLITRPRAEEQIVVLLPGDLVEYRYLVPKRLRQPRPLRSKKRAAVVAAVIPAGALPLRYLLNKILFKGPKMAQRTTNKYYHVRCRSPHLIVTDLDSRVIVLGPRYRFKRHKRLSNIQSMGFAVPPHKRSPANSGTITVAFENQKWVIARDEAEGDAQG
jgi:hypothetical protein